MVVVVPTLAERDERDEQAVAAVIAIVEALVSKTVRERIHEAGAVEKHGRADEETPDDHLPGRGAEAGRVGLQRGSEAIEPCEQDRRPDEVEAVQENQLRIFRQILHEPVIGGKIPAAREPTDVRPEKPLHARRVDIVFIVRVGMVVAMHRCPPERPALNGSQPREREQKLHRPRSVESAMAKVAVIKSRDREHP